ncbi:unnamed protein product, partial [Callosobruchus maculatus]
MFVPSFVVSIYPNMLDIIHIAIRCQRSIDVKQWIAIFGLTLIWDSTKKAVLSRLISTQDGNFVGGGKIDSNRVNDGGCCKQIIELPVIGKAE